MFNQALWAWEYFQRRGITPDYSRVPYPVPDSEQTAEINAYLLQQAGTAAVACSHRHHVSVNSVSSRSSQYLSDDFSTSGTASQCTCNTSPGPSVAAYMVSSRQDHG